MSDLTYYAAINAWWARYDVRHVRIERRFVGTAAARYTARCGQFKGRGTTIRAAVAKAAMQCARPRCCEPVPF